MSGTLLCSRAEAKALGLKRYFTGKPCKHGHISERRVSSNTCIECGKTTYAPLARERASLWYYDNTDRARDNSQRWADSNPESRRAIANRWSSNNREYCRANLATYKARKLSATPPWVNQSDIIEIYETCPDGHHVDHIIPLRHDLVCGLHVPWNLQHLPAYDNLTKSNRFEGGW